MKEMKAQGPCTNVSTQCGLISQLCGLNLLFLASSWCLVSTKNYSVLVCDFILDHRMPTLSQVGPCLSLVIDEEFQSLKIE